MTLTAFKTWFDPQLQQTIRDQAQTYRQLTNDASVLAYCDHIEPLVMGGGKRVRPYLAWLMYKSCTCRDDPSILPALFALELFHTFCLIHDDIIDHGKERHGVETTHVFVHKTLTDQKRLGDLTHMSEGQALLVGDLLFASVTNIIRDTSPAVQKEFGTMINQVILGQMLDVDSATRPTISRDTLNQKMALKTAGYSFISPLKIGALLAGDGEKKTWCESIGRAIGLAYQIQDDLLDITGMSHNQENKTAGNDLRDGQHTFLTLYINEHGSAAEKKQLARYFHCDFLDDEIPNIGQLFETSGAIDAARQEVTQHIDSARETIESANFPQPYQKHWLDLLHILESRT